MHGQVRIAAGAARSVMRGESTTHGYSCTGGMLVVFPGVVVYTVWRGVVSVAWWVSCVVSGCRYRRAGHRQVAERWLGRQFSAGSVDGEDPATAAIGSEMAIGSVAAIG